MIPRGLLDEILETAQTPAEAQQRIARVQAHLDGFAAWKPYRPGPVPLGPHRPSCCCMDDSEIVNGCCTRCWGWQWPAA